MTFLAPILLLGWLALLGTHPAVALVIGVIMVAWPAIRFLVEIAAGAWAAGIGLRLAGFGQPGQARPHLAIWMLACAALIWLAMK